MVAQGMKVGQIGQIITLLNDQIVERVIDLTVAAIGAPEGLTFTWLAFGSEGRQEQTLKTDQDNGILFLLPEGMEADVARARLLPFADRVNLALDAVGFPLCTGNVMARNPECCLSDREWRSRFSRWVTSSTPANLLNASIFFDFRPVWARRARRRSCGPGCWASSPTTGCSAGRWRRTRCATGRRWGCSATSA